MGFWQLYRLNWKLDLIEQIEKSLKNDPVELTNSAKKNYLRIKTSGEINFDKQIYLYNLNESGKPGFEVVNPIKINNENYLINRGWIPFEKKNYLRIKTNGEIDFDKQIYLYNLNESGKPGFEVINPIKIGDENYLINRGWITFEKKDLPEINLVNQNKIVGTLMLQTKPSTFKPDNDIKKNYWFTLNREDIFKFTGRNFSQYVIYLNGEYKIPKPRVITAKISNNHKKYAITWFSMAISILLIYLYFRKKNY